MKKRSTPNSNGIAICDSIVMSVKKKKLNNRLPLAVLLAVCGFTSVIMSFLGMFTLHYDKLFFVTAAVFISLFYIVLSLIGGRALWAYAASSLLFAFTAYKQSGNIVKGFKFVYNIIYKAAYHTDVSYYKSVEPKDEKDSVTIMMIFVVWLLAMAIYYFTICRPNPILPLLVTFPILEIGLYNGIAVPVFWGMLVIGYWLALLAMSTIDGGEYTGGVGGFVRKDDLFFPKRQMKLKVTENCGVFVVASVMLITLVSVIVLNVTNYERSDKLNQKRRDISAAFEEFSFSNLAESLARLTEAFGFDVHYESNKLGRNDNIKYNNETDLIVTFKDPCDGAVYLKEDCKSVYSDNEWDSLSSSAYDDSTFKEVSGSGFFPQDYYGEFAKKIFEFREPNIVTITPKLSDSRSFAPYGADNYGDLTYYDDVIAVCTLKENQTYTFSYASSTDVLYSVSYNYDYDSSVYNISPTYTTNSDNMVEFYPSYYDFLDSIYYDTKGVQDSERYYRAFVYNNYLQLPDSKAMDEIRKEYGDVLPSGTLLNAEQKVKTLMDIREKLNKECRYTLSPGKTPLTRDFVNYFLLENRKGYCVHYATAGVILARMSGIPARYATGYVIVGEDFRDASKNPDGSLTIDVKDNRSHAWTEVYLDGFGWVPFEFTAGFTENYINDGTNRTQTTSPTATTTTTANNYTTTTTAHSSVSVTTTTKVSTSVSATTTTPASNGSARSFRWLLKAAVILLIIALIITSFILRRVLIIRSRQRSFTQGTPREQIGSIYSYITKLLSYLKLSKDIMGYSDFADKVEVHIGGTHFDKGSFKKLMDISLSSGFSKEEPDADEIRHCRETAEAIAGNIYSRASFFSKLWLKYILVLV